MSGYFLAMQIYMAPLLSKIPKQRIIYCGSIIFMFTLFTYGPDIMVNCSPDILMATIYGCSLFYVFEKRTNKISDCISIAMLLSVLVLTKSIGIQWAIFAIVFMFGLDLYRKNKIKFQEIICVLLPGFAWYSWHLFCILFQRTTYLTENMKYGMEVGFFSSDLFSTYGREIFISFFEALFLKQQSGFLGIGLSIIACIILFIILLKILYHYDFISTPDYNCSLAFTILTSILEYGILLFSVETMFIAEYGLYTNSHNMLLLIKRYSSPFIIGSSYLIMHILFTYCNKFYETRESGTNKQFTTKIWLFVISFSIITAPWRALWERYISYHLNPNSLEQSVCDRLPEFENLVTSINEIENPHRQKLLLFIDEDIDIPISISYYAAPVAIVVERYRTDQPDLWKDAIQYYGCTSICFISNNPEWSLLSNVFEENKKHVIPYNIYYAKNNIENELQLSDQCE